MKRLCLLVVCLGVPLHSQAQVAFPNSDNQASITNVPATAAAVAETPTTTFRSGVDLVALNVIVTDATQSRKRPS